MGSPSINPRTLEMARCHQDTINFNKRVEEMRESIRALNEARRYAEEHRAEIDAEWDALPDGRPMRLGDHITPEIKARADAEWADPASIQATLVDEGNGR